ncbi:MAG: hypothetical protein H7267_13000 [Sandarakinorhabdus sp.]|nr:hypothetical protein [Sandarakinorhabdus sp.]
MAFPLVPIEGLDPLQSAMAKDDAATDHLLGSIAASETRWNAIGDMIDGLVKR